ncbi:MAG TPA: hypothetical protein VFT65_11225 [Candidatus Angelobacter sp.]|nr:hypothetical protein [Candidatus Angelobacter sp.]
MFDLITIVLVLGLLLFAGYTAMQGLGKFPRRTTDDVTPYLRSTEIHELESLLDPAQEVNFSLRLSPPEFVAWQRKRIHLMREYLLRMCHNSLVLIEWGNTEAFGEPITASNKTDKQLMAHELVQAATEFRLYSLLALAKLRLWLLCPTSLWFLLRSPSLPGLRNVFGINALASYSRLKNAAETLSLAFSADFQHELAARL